MHDWTCMHQILMRLCTCWLLACPCFLCATRCMSCACVLHCGWVVGHQMPPSPRQHPVDCHPWGWVVGRKAPPSPWQHPSACHRRGWTVPHGLGRRAQSAPVAPAAWLPPLVVRHKMGPSPKQHLELMSGELYAHQRSWLSKEGILNARSLYKTVEK